MWSIVYCRWHPVDVYVYVYIYIYIYIYIYVCVCSVLLSQYSQYLTKSIHNKLFILKKLQACLVTEV